MSGQVRVRVVWVDADEGLVVDASVGSLCAVTAWAGVREGADLRKVGAEQAALVRPWHLSRELVAHLPRLPEHEEPLLELADAAPGTLPERMGAVLTVTVTRGGEPTFAALCWVVGGQWFLIDDRADRRVHRPVPQSFVEYLVGHAGLHAVLLSEEVRCA